MSEKCFTYIKPKFIPEILRWKFSFKKSKKVNYTVSRPRKFLEFFSVSLLYLLILQNPYHLPCRDEKKKFDSKYSLNFRFYDFEGNGAYKLHLMLSN